MRTISLFVALAVVVVALFAGPAHEIFAAEDHLESSACKDRLAGPHIDDCSHDPEHSACVFCVHSVSGSPLSGLTLLSDVPTVDAFESAVVAPSLISPALSLPETRAPPSVIAA